MLDASIFYSGHSWDVHLFLFNPRWAVSELVRESDVVVALPPVNLSSLTRRDTCPSFMNEYDPSVDRNLSHKMPQLALGGSRR
uniref:Uncharacterized protein n=1 Tax=Chromera velia CCMP2878 TaxID=1169474 RepID=A0A0G4HNN6_9ALVE|eukprot:Cvel_29529.t1-p1 / transcript=Cvel_29529.t1 / gene=Cvel_29529 / organism=Chromera_velia_CCMP2878 / gene_product=hypothetical protein / transcript_product=hypothetical protein / location=Cvel_scaffold4056:745-990(+) / protein_length=82 / sequence_SO=supercontig / SO=protein_coding / is_pseudo=false